MKEVFIEKIISIDSEDELLNNESEQRPGRFTMRLYNDISPSITSVYLVVDTKPDLVSKAIQIPFKISKEAEDQGLSVTFIFPVNLLILLKF